VILKDEGKSILLLTKGADNIMLPRIAFQEGMEEEVARHLSEFAIKGL
jgi:hypothetical protein